MLPLLKDITDSDLLENVKSLKNVEDKTLADLVLFLFEVDVRKLYRDIGFSSLYTYCIEGLGYSGASAYRRIQAARTLNDHPEIYELLKNGKLSLCAIAEISKVMTADNKTELLELSQGKPKAEVQKLTLKYQPPVAPLEKEKVIVKKVIVENKDSLFSTVSTSESKIETRFTFAAEVDQEFMDLLQGAKEIVGHMPSVEVIKRSLKEFVSRRRSTPRLAKNSEPKDLEPNPEKDIEASSEQAEMTKIVPNEPKAAKVQPRSRYIPKAVAYRVRERDQHQCTYISPDGRRCSERCGLQVDHIEPFALGGASEFSNLRLLCRPHNQFAAEKSFGREKIQSYFRT